MRHVYYIRIGNKEQRDFTEKCIKDGIVAIAYDKESSFDDLQNVKDDFKKRLLLDPEDEIVKEAWKEYWKNSKYENSLNDIGKTALRRFALAQPKEDYFCTFFNGFFYWGTPSSYDITVRTVVTGKKKEDISNFRCRKLEWTCIDKNKNPVMEGEISGIIGKVRMMQATLSMLHDDDADPGFTQKDAFINTIEGSSFKMVDGLFGIVNKGVDLSQRDISDLKQKIEMMIRNLSPSAFEAFVDIIYTSWDFRRCSTLGSNQIAYDMEYINPDNRSTTFVQVKSAISQHQLNEVMWTLNERLPAGSRCMIVHHMKDINLSVKGVGEEMTIKIRDNATGERLELKKNIQVDFGLVGLNALLDLAFDNSAALVFLIISIVGHRFDKTKMEKLIVNTDMRAKLNPLGNRSYLLI